jgi:hypothetical protein
LLLRSVSLVFNQVYAVGVFVRFFVRRFIQPVPRKG